MTLEPYGYREAKEAYEIANSAFRNCEDCEFGFIVASILSWFGSLAAEHFGHPTVERWLAASVYLFAWLIIVHPIFLRRRVDRLRRELAEFNFNPGVSPERQNHGR